MVYKKNFKVAELLLKANGNTHHCLMVAADGECWLVAVDNAREDWQNCLWRVGVIVEVELILTKGRRGDRIMAPDWSALGAENPLIYNLLTPADTVSKLWGKFMAERYFPDEARSTSC